ncbi:MAG: hypothetical protein ACI9T9_002153 [Oleiphilaceae bacterium]|jgi:hypothetical protein
MKKDKVYAVFEFDNFSEAGLKKFSKLLERKDSQVASITATNRAARKDGLQTKRATLFFVNQQKIEILIGDAGDIVTLKINGKIQPSGSPSSLADFANHIAKLLKNGQLKFDKALRRKTDKIKVDTPKAKVASRTNKVRIEEAEALLQEAKDTLAELRVTANVSNEALTTSTTAQDKLVIDYDTEMARNRSLKQQLNELRKAA